MISTFLFLKTLTANAISGPFSYLKTNFNFSPTITSSEEISNLSTIIDLSKSDNYARLDYPKLPLTIYFDLGQFSILAMKYLMQGKTYFRGMTEWELLGRNAKSENWIRIDYRKNYNYCNIRNNDDCLNESFTIIPCQNITKLFRFIQFKMIADGFEENDLFRLQHFELYGPLFTVITNICLLFFFCKTILNLIKIIIIKNTFALFIIIRNTIYK